MLLYLKQHHKLLNLVCRQTFTMVERWKTLSFLSNISQRFFWGKKYSKHSPFLSTTAPSCVAFLLLLTDFFHSPAACWESSCSHQCCFGQRSPWLSGWWSLAASVFGPGSRRSRHGRASECQCKSTPGPN